MIKLINVIKLTNSTVHPTYLSVPVHQIVEFIVK